MTTPVAAASQPIPVTLLTGFLGAGKTTLVRRLLIDAQDERVAVIVNEFGPLGIDSDRISGARGPVLEMLNGCICCASEGDLLRAIDTLLTEGDEIDAILIETSGLADPWPIIEAIDTVSLSKPIALSAVVTLVDADRFDENLDQAEAAYQQLTSADLFVINKADLVEPAIAELIAQRLRALNPKAAFVTTTQAELPTGMIGSVGHRAATLGRVGRPSHDHTGYQSALLTAATELDPHRFDDWLSTLPPDIVRMKGVISLAGTAQPASFDRVGSRISVVALEDAASLPGASRIVAIGRALDETLLMAGFAECGA